VGGGGCKQEVHAQWRFWIAFGGVDGGDGQVGQADPPEIFCLCYETI
jgi:hypothetical protein